MRKSLNKIKRFNDYIHQLTKELEVITKKITNLEDEIIALSSQKKRLLQDIEAMDSGRDSSSAFIERASFYYSLKLNEDLLVVGDRLNTLDKRKRLLIRTRVGLCLKIITLKKVVAKYVTKVNRLTEKSESRELEDISNSNRYTSFS